MRVSVNQVEIARILSEALNLLQPWLDEGPEQLLQAVVNHARNLVGASFAGILILDGDNPAAYRYFKVSGWNSIPAQFPTGHGMFILPARTGQSLRVESISGHPLSVGVPSDHPPVEALLTIPLTLHSQPIGCMFLGKPPESGSFSTSDEELMNAFAAMCSIAISWCNQQDETRLHILADERQRIAAELHDSLSQTLFGLAREMEQLERQPVPRSAEERTAYVQRLTRVRRLTERSQSELRAILFALRDADMKPNEVALAHLVQEFERLSGISTQLTTHGALSQLPLSVRQTILKVVAESLSNIYRHANSPVALVHVDVGPHKVTVAVQDAGIGISDEALRLMHHSSGHFGLHAMTRSIAALHGTLEVFRNDDAGTTVRCTFPYDRGGGGEP